MTRRTLVAVAALATVLLLAGCGGGSEGGCDQDEPACTTKSVMYGSTDPKLPVAVALVRSGRGDDVQRTVLLGVASDGPSMKRGRLTCDTGKYRPSFGASIRAGRPLGSGPDAEFDRLVRHPRSLPTTPCRLEAPGRFVELVSCASGSSPVCAATGGSKQGCVLRGIDGPRPRVACRPL